MKRLLTIALVALVTLTATAQMQNVKTYTLPNGLTVFLWEDPNQNEVLGQIVVRAGSMDEPAEYTGLAHYLEHMMFKGTQTIGAFDWPAEKPHYEKIIALYDQLAETTDPAARETILTQINEESLASAPYAFTNEFCNLVEGIGGEGLNAGTSYDQTVYYNTFPPYQMDRWLELYSERLINPVFRTFQAELENVYEEFNMYQDNRSQHVSNYIFSHLYPNHPYGRDVIGYQDHLKNPRLSRLIEFYNKWYIPSNMALILAGNFRTDEVIPLIEKRFGRLEAKPQPEREQFPLANYAGEQKYRAKLGYYPSNYWAFKGVKKGDKEEILLDFCTNILTNSAGTGLLDKLAIDGDALMAGGYNMSRRDQGTILIVAIPSYDMNQQRWASDKEIQTNVFNQIKKLAKGDIPEWLIASVKESLCREYDLMLESNRGKVGLLTEVFTYNEPLEHVANYKDIVRNITIDDIKRVANQYFNTEDYISFSFTEGTPKRTHLEKPHIKPIEQPQNKKSDYAENFYKIPMGQVAETFCDFNAVKTTQLDANTKLFYTPNPVNDVFSLRIRYGIGTNKMPRLELATQLLNNAGILPNVEAQQVKRMFSEAGATCSYACDDSYFYITLYGNENKLVEACEIMQKQIYMPFLDSKQLDNMKGSIIGNRLTSEKKDPQVLEQALVEYLLYGQQSDYIDRLSMKTIYDLPLATLTGDIIRATKYPAEVHYCGRIPIDQISETLRSHLPLSESNEVSTSPEVKEAATFTTPQIYFLPNSETAQAKIYFYVHGKPYTCADDVAYDAFYQYFSGDFNGLVMNEIRENNSMAYTTYGYISRPPVPDKTTFFIGFVGTQSDKAADAVKLYMRLLTDMPLYPERIDNIKTYLHQSALTNKPSFRGTSLTYEAWKLRGYTEDPAKTNLSKIDALTFDDIVNFYNAYIKGQPISIVIMGNPKNIDLKKIGEFGKVKKISPNKLFNTEEDLF